MNHENPKLFLLTCFSFLRPSLILDGISVFDDEKHSRIFVVASTLIFPENVSYSPCFYEPIHHFAEKQITCINPRAKNVPWKKASLFTATKLCEYSGEVTKSRLLNSHPTLLHVIISTWNMNTISNRKRFWAEQEKARYVRCSEFGVNLAHR